MNASAKIIDFLKKSNVSYEVLEHPPAYTAMEIAGKQHIPGRMVVKSVIVNADGKVVMCVLPAIHMIDFDSLRAVTGAKHLRLATEEELSQIFPDFDIGAEPPFGQIYGLPVFVDKYLENDSDIVFNAGTHTDMIKINYQDYIRLAKPTVAEFGTHI